MKRNCWEFKNCGRQEGGANSKILGVCPAAVETRLHGVHDGNNGGRACWVVAGTMCSGKIQGSFAQKYENCEKCDFYRTVKREEGASHELSIVILKRMRSTEENNLNNRK